MRNDLDGAAPVRLAELIAALSLATDLGMGHPLEHALCSCVLAVRLGEALGLDAPALREVYYQALLRYIGCNAETHTLAAVVGDELAMRRDFAAIDNANQGAVLSLMLRYIRQANAGAPPLQLAREVVRGLLAGPEIQASFAGHCEVAQRLGARLGFEAPIIVALGQLYERWDGRGLPRGLKGEEIAPAVLIVALAQDALTVRRLGGVDAAVGMARQRSGGAYDPRMVDCFCGQAPALFAGLDEAPSWETVLGMEPGARSYLAEDQLDTACQAMADFADLKSPYTLGHSSGVAELAAGAAQRCGLPAADVTAIRRAGWLHDLGRVGVSISIWD
jgi:HD-GYP domain-containing protein (c-di-GMP phosphodiesterase class II)